MKKTKKKATELSWYKPTPTRPILGQPNILNGHFGLLLFLWFVAIPRKSHFHWKAIIYSPHIRYRQFSSKNAYFWTKMHTFYQKCILFHRKMHTFGQKCIFFHLKMHTFGEKCIFYDKNAYFLIKMHTFWQKSLKLTNPVYF